MPSCRTAPSASGHEEAEGGFRGSGSAPFHWALGKVAHLRHERDEAVELQAASAAVLKAISSSPGDLHSIFRVMLANALRICEAKFGHLLLYDVTRPTCMMFPDPIASTGLGRLAWSKQVIHQI